MTEEATEKARQAEAITLKTMSFIREVQRKVSADETPLVIDGPLAIISMEARLRPQNSRPPLIDGVLTSDR